MVGCEDGSFPQSRREENSQFFVKPKKRILSVAVKTLQLCYNSDKYLSQRGIGKYDGVPLYLMKGIPH